MDTSIRVITPEDHETRGAQAYDEGLGVDDHGLEPGSSARKYWKFGWHMRRVERTRARAVRLQQLAEVSPP